MLGPTGLDTSRHRGVTPSFAPRGASKGKPRGAFRASQGLRKSASPKASRARCLRFAPHGPRWTDLSGDPPLLIELEGRLSTALGPRSGRQTCDRLPVSAITGPRGARQARRDTCGLDRRALASHLRCKVIPRPPLPAPRLKMLYRHPSVRGGMREKIVAVLGAGISFFAAFVFNKLRARSGDRLARSLSPPHGEERRASDASRTMGRPMLRDAALRALLSMRPREAGVYWLPAFAGTKAVIPHTANFARTRAALSASARTVTANWPSSRRCFSSTSEWR